MPAPLRFFANKAVFFAGVLAFLIFCWLPKNMADPDIWWHLRNAGAQFAGHAWLHNDGYSFTAAGAPWINHEWLSEVPYYFGWRTFGPQGVLMVALLATECVLLLNFYLTYRLSNSLVATLIGSVLATLFATISFGPRTLIFGWLCLMVELILLDCWRKDELGNRAALITFPVLFAFWINLHGSWLIGMILLLGFLVCESVWPVHGLDDVIDWGKRDTGSLWKATACSIVALFANPYGWRLVLYPFDLAFKQKLNVASVDEWHPLDFHTPRAKIFLLCLIALFLLQLARKAKWALHELLFVAAGVYGACLYSRFLFLGGLLICPILAKQATTVFASNKPRQTHSNGWFHAAVLCGLAIVAMARFPSAAAMRAQQAQFPDKALLYLKDFHPDGPVFNEFLWGGYLEWHTRQLPVFIDSRVDIFERNGTLKDYLDIVLLKNTLPLLQKHGIRYVLFSRDTPLIKLLEQTREWRVLYEDPTTVLLERKAHA